MEEIINLVKYKEGIAPIKPRVLIIGPRGSGRNTQAEMLKNHLGLVHGKYVTTNIMPLSLHFGRQNLIVFYKHITLISFFFFSKL